MRGYKKGCRCPECRAAAAAYMRAWRHARLRPMVVPPDVTVPAGTTRRYIEELRDSGLGSERIAELAKVHHRAIERIASGEVDRVTPDVRDAVLAVPLGSVAPNAAVDSTRARQYVADLVDEGWTRYRIARAAGVSVQSVVRLQSSPRVLARTADALRVVWLDAFPGILDPEVDDSDPLAMWRLLLSDIGDQSWRKDAECRRLEGHPRSRVELFFPERGGDVEAPRAVCERCPVTAPCLEFALVTNTTVGVWGNTTGKDRRRLRQERAS